jgi:esterase/lipase
MTEAITVALITGGLSLAGVVITCIATSRKTEKAQAVAQAVTETKIDELTREVREHNGFAQRMPKLESDIEHIKEEIKELKAYHKHE